MRNSYLNYIHNFRGYAIFGILAIHCRRSLPWDDHKGLESVSTIFFDNSTILFVFIAGFLFQHLRDRYDYRSYLFKKAKYVLLPYIVFSFLPIMEKLSLDEGFIGIIKDTLYYLFTGKHFGPFWFIPMISVLYVFSPLLIWLDRKIVYLTVFPIIFIAGLFTYRFGYYSNTFASLAYFVPIYFLGMFASRYKEGIQALGNKLFIPLLTFYVILAFLEFQQLIDVPRLLSWEDTVGNRFFALNLVKFKVSILCFIWLHIFYKLRNLDLLIFKKLGDYSFGIFFIHLYFIIIFEFLIKRFLPEYISFNILSYSLYVMAVVLASTFTIALIKRILPAELGRMITGS